MTKLTARSSKIQEIEYLQKLKDEVPTDCYLGSLFSTELLNWVTAQINTDIAPDVMGALTFTHQNSSKSFEINRKEIQRLEDRIKNLELNRERSKTQFSEVIDELQEAKTELGRTRSEKNATEMKNRELRSELDRKNEIVLRVKAENYDLTHS